ncbi:hypothetical protein CKALI_06330 [Corynebacterium kalinowskii]|uniref:Secreted protein n=1 Tax=Corynebacterium kalinowskii TaxID=2675216 RepID=A0A6B8VT01_9CORY|nr:hypothetical protein [Corynebacterium kalinowskii]QGU02135.1 hypothetical protein CKALI_06330 [Corynebacterium kalinowskii]
MKLISRKAITATIAAAAISTASLTAPAMAQTTTPTTTPVTTPATTPEAPAKDTTTPEAPAKDNGSSASGSSDDSADLSSEFFVKKDKDGNPIEMTAGEKLKEIISILTGVGALFGAIITINNNMDRLMKSFQI